MLEKLKRKYGGSLESIIITGKKLREDGILADVAPTLLDVMGVPVPKEMSGKSLIIE